MNSKIKRIVTAATSAFCLACTTPHRQQGLQVIDRCGEIPRVLIVEVHPTGPAWVRNYRGRKLGTDESDKSCMPVGGLVYKKTGDKYGECKRFGNFGPTCDKAPKFIRRMLDQKELSRQKNK